MVPEHKGSPDKLNRKIQLWALEALLTRGQSLSQIPWSLTFKTLFKLNDSRYLLAWGSCQLLAGEAEDLGASGSSRGWR